MRITKIEVVESEDVVYDLETTAGTFLAGTIKSGIMVKNTDSCYITPNVERKDFNSEDEFMREVFRESKRCATLCTSKFKKPMEIVLENIKHPFLLFTKKRYVYKEWTGDPDKEITADEELKSKGIQTLRRDTCKYVREELTTLLNILINSNTDRKTSIDNAVKFAQTSIKNLLDCNINPSKLVLSKQLKGYYILRENNKSIELHWTDPNIKQSHVRLAQQLAIKDPVNHPKPPDRVPFIFINAKNSKLQCDKVMHPEDVDKIDIIDTLYYFEHQYKKPLNMIFELLMDKKKVSSIYENLVLNKINKMNGQTDLSKYFDVKKPLNKITTWDSKEFMDDMSDESDN